MLCTAMASVTNKPSATYPTTGEVQRVPAMIYHTAVQEYPYESDASVPKSVGGVSLAPGVLNKGRSARGRLRV